MTGLLPWCAFNYDNCLFMLLLVWQSHWKSTLLENFTYCRTPQRKLFSKCRKYRIWGPDLNHADTGNIGFFWNIQEIVGKSGLLLCLQISTLLSDWRLPNHHDLKHKFANEILKSGSVALQPYLHFYTSRTSFLVLKGSMYPSKVTSFSTLLDHITCFTSSHIL